MLIIQKKATINPKNDDDKCFHQEPTIALNHEKIQSHLESISNIIPFINNYNWKGISCLSKIEDWNRFEKNI